jgi:hypothetical protein
MLLARLRRSSRFLALLLLISFWGLGHKAGDDVCASDLPQAHDESQHAIGAPAGTVGQHCAICHLVRTPRGPYGSITTVRIPLLDGGLVLTPEAVARRAPALDRLPARAPPASLT